MNVKQIPLVAVSLVTLGSVSMAMADEVSDVEKAAPAGLRMNQIQVIATHNSYHVRPQDPLFTQVKAVYPDAATWDYTHAALDVQLERGVRSFELDVYADPAGTKVMHVPQFDKVSTCKTFVEGLTTIKSWSDKNLRHVPILILVELKDEKIPQVKAPILPFDAPALDRLDKEIRSVFPAERLLTPDDVRGNCPTLSEAIASNGWPALDKARGKVMLVLHARGLHGELYTKDRPSLQGRAMFMESQEGKPYASVFICNDPADPTIAKLVKQGYIVRTRADSDLKEVINGGSDRRDAALASGAQIVSTDFPPGEPFEKNGYVLMLPGAVRVRLNPLCGTIAEKASPKAK